MRANQTQLPASCPRRGTAATELALVLPLILLLIGGTLDLGRAVHVQIVLSNSVRVGAEYGATHRASTRTLAAWRARMTSEVTSAATGINGFDPTRLTVTVSMIDDDEDHQVITVSASYPLKQQLFLPTSADTMTITQAVTWRQFR